MGWRDKGRNGPTLFAQPHIACFHINANAFSARQFIEGAAIRKLDPLLNFYRKCIPTRTANGVKRFILKNISLSVRVK